VKSVLICDDHPVVRRGLREIVVSELRAKDVGEASTAQQALEAVRRRAWDVVLLDITMPGKSGLEVIKELKRARPRLPILVISFHPEEHYAVRCVRAGAAGYLNKGMVPDELVKALRTVLEGRTYVSGYLADKLVHALGAGANHQPHEALSDREYQVMCLIAVGKSVKEIAYDLSLSIKTVSTYRTRSLEKLGVKTNAEVVRYAMHHGLVSFD
jgi:two-component system, NarL family, invasion response regulator UvrY